MPTSAARGVRDPAHRARLAHAWCLVVAVGRPVTTGGSAKLPGGRRRRGGPFERRGAPRILGGLPAARAPMNVPEEHELETAEGHGRSTSCARSTQRRLAQLVLQAAVVEAPVHAHDAHQEHGQEDGVHRHERAGEVHEAEVFRPSGGR